jgi:hypothetical protein
MIQVNKSDAKTKTGKGALALLALTILVCGPTFAYEDYEVDTSEIGRDTQGVVTSGQILELGVPSANGLRMEGENYLKSGHLEQAIIVLQKSVEMAPNDVDGRILYGEALEKKLLHQNPRDRDPSLYNFVIKQWLVVAKSGEFADQMQQGYNHLLKLTGTFPKRREKERKYLERVLIPEDGSVKVTIGRPPAAGNQVDTKPIAQTKKAKDEDL